MKMRTRLSQRLAAIGMADHSGDILSPLDISTRIATTAAERLEAARLVGRQYRAEGYLGQEQNDNAPFFTPHHGLPEATVFIAREGERIAGTLTVVIDSNAGLPMEDLYSEEVADLRLRGRTLCEICSLSVDPQREERSSLLVLSLFRYATAYLLHFTRVTDALITLKPTHADFYGRRLRFQPLGATKRDRRFRDADTVLMGLARERVESPGVPRTRAERLHAIVFSAASREELASLEQALPFKGLCAEEELRVSRG
jgi:hypothetical protein